MSDKIKIICPECKQAIFKKEKPLCPKCYTILKEQVKQRNFTSKEEQETLRELLKKTRRRENESNGRSCTRAKI